MIKKLSRTHLSAEASFPIPKSRSTHPLFEPEQAFLWLPGFFGEEEPYCTYNGFREYTADLDIRHHNPLPERDDNGISYIPPTP